MAMHSLDLESLKLFDDGRVAIAFAQELRRAVQDAIDRPGVKRPRVISLEATVTPICEEGGFADDAWVHFKVKSKTPTRESKSVRMTMNKKGHLLFSENNADDVRQTHLDDIADPAGTVKREVIDGKSAAAGE